MDKLNLDRHISQQFNEDLEAIKSQMLEMGGMVEKQLDEAVSALEQADSQLAEHVLTVEEEVDEKERQIDESCTTLIALRQPAATDLRMIMAVSKCIRDLERIGDEAQKIAKMAIRLIEEGPTPRGYIEIRHIADDVQAMLNDALDAFLRFDSTAAINTMRRDAQVDADYKSALRELITYMMEDPRNISRSLDIAWVLRALERIGDHAKNICEQVVYLVQGKDIRHGHLDDVR
ncbi:MAG TPA: phosphate transport system regulatory protein PhoU [Gammaproteobacteria bacterium]|nr:phosphate transport system regulatory protein PhoU [Gammaproteobacteria bacterium]